MVKVNIVCTSKPCDGLLYYSYEHCTYLRSIGIDAQVVCVPHPRGIVSEYRNALIRKYGHANNVIVNNYLPKNDEITLIMGRSMLTLPHKVRKEYKRNQLLSLHLLFSNKIVAVYSENHPVDYPRAVAYWSPKKIWDLCDYDVYPEGEGEHFKKVINFSMYKPWKDEIQYDYLFNGVNENYYTSILKYIHLENPDHIMFGERKVTELPFYEGQGFEYKPVSTIKNFKSHAILTLSDKLVRNNNYHNPFLNNVTVPVKNILGSFDTYVYVKEGFDPAPRLMMECKYFKKKMIFLRDDSIVDGGSAYLKRESYCLTSPENKENNDVLVKAIKEAASENVTS